LGFDIVFVIIIVYFVVGIKLAYYFSRILYTGKKFSFSQIVSWCGVHYRGLALLYVRIEKMKKKVCDFHYFTISLIVFDDDFNFDD